MVTKKDVENAREWAVEAAMGGVYEAWIAEDAETADAAWLEYFKLKEAFEKGKAEKAIEEVEKAETAWYDVYKARAAWAAAAEAAEAAYVEYQKLKEAFEKGNITA